MRLVFVHGRSQQRKDPAVLRAEWLDALGIGFQRGGVHASTTEIRLAYYGDLLADLVDRVEQHLPPDIAARAAGSGPPSYASTQRAILHELITGAGISDAQVAAELSDAQARDPQNWGWVLAAVRALSRIPGLDARLIDSWLRDVSLYVTNAAVQRAVDQVVTAELDTTPFVLVAHSLGTVVSYNVLRSQQDTTPCRGLVTLGSRWESPRSATGSDPRSHIHPMSRAGSTPTTKPTSWHCAPSISVTSRPIRPSKTTRT
ncbi:hypothetical protein [Nocardia sp. NPDC047648]|uniref:hypothetical protein n=1 Tax=Nocardia sp. NPDC047648 TaxID=3155625 RepID=UPI00340558AF